MSKQETPIALLERVRVGYPDAGLHAPCLVSMGYDELDQSIGGWYPGSLNLILGREGGSLSTLLLSMAYAAARKGTKVAFLSMKLPTRKWFAQVLRAEHAECLDRSLPHGDPFLDRPNLMGRSRTCEPDIPLFLWGKAYPLIEEVWKQVMRCLDEGVELIYIDGLRYIDTGWIEQFPREEPYEWKFRGRRTLAHLMWGLKGVEMPIVLSKEILEEGYKGPDMKGGRLKLRDEDFFSGIPDRFSSILHLYEPPTKEEMDEEVELGEHYGIRTLLDPIKQRYGRGEACSLYFDRMREWFCEDPYSVEPPCY